MTKEEVLQLEKELSFQEFNNHDAYQLPTSSTTRWTA